MAQATVGSAAISGLAEFSLFGAPQEKSAPSLLTRAEHPVELPLRHSVLEFRISGEEPRWLYPTLSCFRELVQLPEDWDSYGASIITDEAIAGAAEVMVELELPLEAPPPDVVPGSSGSVQLEWHRSGADVEIHISSAGTPTAFFSDAGEDQEFEKIDQEAAAQLSGVLARMVS